MAPGGECHNNASRVLTLQKGDYLEAYANQNSGGNLAIQASGTLPQLNSFMSITEIPDFSTFSVFGNTQLIESSNTSLSSFSITAGQYGDPTSITLDPGEWDLSCNVMFDNNGAVTAQQHFVGIS